MHTYQINLRSKATILNGFKKRSALFHSLFHFGHMLSSQQAPVTLRACVTPHIVHHHTTTLEITDSLEKQSEVYAKW